MSSTHTTTLKLALIEGTRKGWRLFVNTIAHGWVGKLERDHPSSFGEKCVELSHARFFTFGLGSDTFDAVGWRTLEITQDMVGKSIAQIVWIDAKTQGYKRLSKGQRNFAQQVRKAGGFVGVAQQIEGAQGRIAIAEIGEE
jgi:hypothetical protein